MLLLVCLNKSGNNFFVTNYDPYWAVVIISLLRNYCFIFEIVSATWAQGVAISINTLRSVCVCAHVHVWWAKHLAVMPTGLEHLSFQNNLLVNYSLWLRKGRSPKNIFPKCSYSLITMSCTSHTFKRLSRKSSSHQARTPLPPFQNRGIPQVNSPPLV